MDAGYVLFGSIIIISLILGTYIIIYDKTHKTGKRAGKIPHN